MHKTRKVIITPGMNCLSGLFLLPFPEQPKRPSRNRNRRRAFLQRLGAPKFLNTNKFILRTCGTTLRVFGLGRGISETADSRTERAFPLTPTARYSSGTAFLAPSALDLSCAGRTASPLRQWAVDSGQGKQVGRRSRRNLPRKKGRIGSSIGFGIQHSSCSLKNVN